MTEGSERSADASGVPAVVVAIGGGSGSGKSTLADALSQELRDLDPVLIGQDHYFRDFLEYEPAERERVHTVNHPEGLNWREFHAALEALARGGRAVIPAPGTRAALREMPPRTVGPARVVIVEGLFALWDRRCRQLADLRLFTEVAEDERVLRRLQRDVRERGSTLDRAVAWYRRDVAPNYPTYTQATRAFADLVVPTGHDCANAVFVIAQAVRVMAAARSSRDLAESDSRP